ncbi:unnamed protein product [Acanthoscelides obtectus]|uniref:Uncharacterized protein n=1 Tax=Acanthoscelides obtectus TaxID=200917 RepID=A0A9P0LLY3_ACAOB|nr:unnamed protein product [Acanthoscelides obtectus]CAK1628348.1 hypothetical protein AOBTE_LOCUS5149 [Acanthoscelides obtectus]
MKLVIRVSDLVAVVFH